MADNEATPLMEQDELWRGIDLSGISVVLGLAGGRLVQALARQAAIAGDGRVIAMGYDLDALEQLLPLMVPLPVSPVNARLRQIPLLDETVDLLVMNGTLRQVPESQLLAMCQEIWRVLVPGGQLRIADLVEPSEAPYNEAWRIRNELIAKLGRALERPTALYVNLTQAAAALTEIGFENLAVSLLPGYPLTEAWLDSTQQAVQAMVSRVVDTELRDEVLQHDLQRLISAYQLGEQRAAERFVLRGSKIGDLALNMQASFTEEDLVDEDE